MSRAANDLNPGDTFKTVSIRLTADQYQTIKDQADQRTSTARYEAARKLSDSDAGAKAVIKAAESMGTLDKLAKTVTITDLAKERLFPAEAVAVS